MEKVNGVRENDYHRIRGQVYTHTHVLEKSVGAVQGRFAPAGLLYSAIFGQCDWCPWSTRAGTSVAPYRLLCTSPTRGRADKIVYSAVSRRCSIAIYTYVYAAGVGYIYIRYRQLASRLGSDYLRVTGSLWACKLIVIWAMERSSCLIGWLQLQGFFFYVVQVSLIILIRIRPFLFIDIFPMKKLLNLIERTSIIVTNICASNVVEKIIQR